MVNAAVGGLRGRPLRPAVGFVDQVGVRLPDELGFHRPFLLQVIEVFQEEQPGGLLGVIELGTTAIFLPENIVNVLEGLLERGRLGGRRRRPCRRLRLASGVAPHRRLNSTAKRRCDQPLLEDFGCATGRSVGATGGVSGTV